MRRFVSWSVLLACLGLSLLVEAAPPEKKKREEKLRFDVDVNVDALLDPNLVPGGSMAPALSMGATPGGAQDIGYFRDRIACGEIPLPQTFTPEGLFSEHDLPVTNHAGCKQTFCAEAEAMQVSMLGQTDVEFLAQLGFSSGLDPKTFKRAPLNLVAVVDRSGSMNGAPLELVRASLREVVQQLGPDDRLSIVGYESTAYVMLQPTSIKQRKDIDRAIDSLVSAGATAMEEGLRVGFELAEREAKQFRGTTRVMLFTDERPNVGRTDAASFMGMARAASGRGVGLTTIGVSTHFGAELAQELSSVRGGNLYFFPNAQDMKDKFADEFDTMVTELAYDLNLVITPAKGMQIVGVYGIPGSALQWHGDSIELDVETIFVSRRKGAIYVGFAREGTPNLPNAKITVGDVLGQVQLRYEDASGGKTHKADAAFAVVDRKSAGLGLTRGELLTDMATSLRRATTLHHDHNDQEGAYQLVRALGTRLGRAQDPELARELELVAQLEDTLAKASGHHGEHASAVTIDPITGLPPRL
jgi:Ca-activated chloride channel family protein